MSNLKDVQQIQSLIAKGKGSGYLTFEEVNKALPVEMSTPEQFEEIIGIFEQLEIVIVDSEKEGKKIASRVATESEEGGDKESIDITEDEDSADYSSRSTDPVRMYLREMGAVPLLDRDGEVVIAKKIELGEQDVLGPLLRRVGHRAPDLIGNLNRKSNAGSATVNINSRHVSPFRLVIQTFAH